MSDMGDDHPCPCCRGKDFNQETRNAIQEARQIAERITTEELINAAKEVKSYLWRCHPTPYWKPIVNRFLRAVERLEEERAWLEFKNAKKET